MRKLIFQTLTSHGALRKALMIGMAALLVTGMVFSIQSAAKVFAAPVACTSVADGDWGSASTWSCAAVPGDGDTATVVNAVALSSNHTVSGLTIGAGGYLYFTNASTLTLNGDLTINGGIFAPQLLDPDGLPLLDGGTVVFGPGSQTILTNGAWVDFWNLTKLSTAAGDSLSVDPGVFDADAGVTVGGIHVLNHVALQGSPDNYLLLNSTVPASQWQIWVDLDYDINYVDVQDSANVSPGGTPLTVPMGTDLGNNTNWWFGGAPSVFVTSSANPAIVGTSVTFTATVLPGDATGTVEFELNGVDITGCEYQPITAGVATCTVTDLAAGNHDITAIYSGDDNYSSASSTPFTQIMTELQISLKTSVSPTAVNSPVTFEVQVTPMLLGIVPMAGSVTFSVDGTPVADCTGVGLNASAKAGCTLSTLAVGPHTVTAKFTMDGTGLVKDSNIVTQTVKNTSALNVASSANPSDFGKTVILTATITTPTGVSGTVAFKEGGLTVAGCASVNVVGGVATCDLTNLKPGLHTFTVEYSGDANTFGVQVGPIEQVVVARYFLPFIGQ